MIQAALRAKGADEEVVAQVLSEDDPAQKSERILAQIRKKERTFPAGLTARERSKKLFDYLVRRGFAPEAVIAALRKKGDSIDDDSP